MILFLYDFLWKMVRPIIRYYLRRRARKNPDYLQNWSERFGEAYPNPVKNAIWLHAVSVGETRAAQPLILALRRHFPDAPLLITQMTPTGRVTAQQLFPDAQCRYLPYDHADWVAQFFTDHQPKFGIIMETEIWANVFQAAKNANIPIFLANARLSEKSLRGYLKIAPLVRGALANVSAVFAQTDADAKRLQQLGAANIYVLGNTKFDAPIPVLTENFRQKIGERKIFVAASLRERDGVDEAHLILHAWQNRPKDGALLVVIPRHPERFQTTFDTANALGFRVQKRSDNKHVSPETDVWIGDSMGEMFAYYGAADAVFVGGSLVETGCQNIIEPMLLGKAVLFGFSTYNFQAACENALASHAAIQIRNANQLVRKIDELFRQPEKIMQLSTNAQKLVAQHQGASERIAAAISDFI